MRTGPLESTWDKRPLTEVERRDLHDLREIISNVMPDYSEKATSHINSGLGLKQIWEIYIKLDRRSYQSW